MASNKRVTRSIIAAFSALTLGVLSIGASLGAGPGAQAFTPANFEPDATGKVKIKTTVSHTLVGGREPGPGDTYTFTAKYAFSQFTENNVSHSAELTVFADPNGQWTSVPTVSDFTIAGTTASGLTLQNCSTSGCTLLIDSISGNGTITFVKQARADTSLRPGESVTGAAKASVTTTPDVSLVPGPKTFTGDNGTNHDCSGTMKFEGTVAKAGAWLMDIRYADGRGEDGVALDDASRIVPWNAAAPGAKNTIRVTSPSGADITSAIMGSATYVKPDPTAPHFTSAQIQNYPDAKWLDSLNWKWDPSSYTGDTWLQTGTKIEVTRGVKYANCVAGFAADYQDERPLIQEISIARPRTTVHDLGVDVFTQPGKAIVLQCAQTLWISTDTSAGVGDPGYSTIRNWNPATGEIISPRITDAQGNPANVLPTHSIAAHSKWPNSVFSVAQDGSAYRAQQLKSEPGQLKIVRNSAPIASGRYIDPIAGAFDKAGNWWFANYYDLYKASAASVEAWVNGGAAPNFQKMATLYYQSPIGPRYTWGQISDIAFDKAGNMWVEQALSKSNQQNRLGTVPGWATLQPGTNNLVVQHRAFTPRTTTRSLARGLAFINNTLYRGQFNSRQIQIINQANGQLGYAPRGNVGIGNISDLASCVAPQQTQQAKFEWRKSAINPDGSISPAGTTGQAHALRPDGTISVDYLITVSNVGTKAGTVEAITDSISLPRGFSLKNVNVNGESKGASPTITLPSKQLNAGQSVTYIVTVEAQVSDIGAVNWGNTQDGAAGKCVTSGPGRPGGGGMFNTALSTANDSDGADNNDACIPVTAERAKLTLIKDIADTAGNPLPGSQAASHFTLSAAGSSQGGQPGLVIEGSSPAGGQIAVSKQVTADTYQLRENPNSAHGQGYSAGKWSCTNRGNALAVSDGAVVIQGGADVTCRVTNRQKPTLHLVKLPSLSAPTTDGSPGPAHYGQAVTPGGDGGELTVSYKLVIKNTSAVTASAGAVSDVFEVPAGLKWDGVKRASVSFEGGGASAVGLRGFVTREELAGGAVLADGVNGIGAGGQAVFTVSVPLVLDLAPTAGNPRVSVWESQREALSTCEPTADRAGRKVLVSGAKGVVNRGFLAGEDRGYSADWEADNTACVPVGGQSGWKVSKAAPKDGEIGGYAPAGEAGSPVSLAGDNTVAVTYRVSVTNEGAWAGAHPAITDTVSLPEGLAVKNVSSTGPSGTVTDHGGAASFTLADSGFIVPGASASYLVKVVAQAADPGAVNWGRAGVCNTAGPGVPADGGLFNVVAMDGDLDGPDNNDACVPLLPAAKPITVMKRGVNCDAGIESCPLEGSQFLLYDTDPEILGATPISGGLTVDGVDGSKFTSPGLKLASDYWIVESKAAPGHELLARPIKFRVTPTGIALDPGNSNAVVRLAAGDPTGLTLEVIDVTAGKLPKAGADGYWPYLLLALVVIGGGGLNHLRNTIVVHRSQRSNQNT